MDDICLKSYRFCSINLVTLVKCYHTLLVRLNILNKFWQLPELIYICLVTLPSFFFLLPYNLVNLILLSGSILPMHRIIRKIPVWRSLVNRACVQPLSVVTGHANLSFFLLFPSVLLAVAGEASSRDPSSSLLGLKTFAVTSLKPALSKAQSALTEGDAFCFIGRKASGPPFY